MERKSCRNCGKKLARILAHHNFSAGSAPMTEADADEYARQCGEVRVAIKWKTFPSGGRFVSSMSTWDGKTYVDPYFCKRDCATAFGYEAAKAGIVRIKRQSGTPGS